MLPKLFVRELNIQVTYLACEIDKLADIVITSLGGYPKDIDLYQTHKAMENANLAVKKGGIIIIAGECRDGLGEESFSEALNGKL